MTLDITGENARKLLYIEDLFKALMEKYNYQYIKTPTLEDEQMLGVIEDGDYLDFNLRPSGMVGVIRNFINQNANKQLGIQKFWYNGSMFNSDNFFENYELGFDVLGSYNSTLDVEVMNLVINFYRLLGLNEFILKINTNGEEKHFDKVLEYLRFLEIDYIVDDSLFLDKNYYTDTIFEIITNNSKLEEQLVIGSGGRYNNLINRLSAIDTPGFGFSLNLNNLLTVLDYDGLILNKETTLDAYIINSTDSVIPFSLKLLEMLRMNGFSVEFDHNNQQEAEALNTKFIIKVDEQSVSDTVLTIINNRTKEEFKIEEEYIINFLDEKVSGEDEEDIY